MVVEFETVRGMRQRRKFHYELGVRMDFPSAESGNDYWSEAARDEQIEIAMDPRANPQNLRNLARSADSIIRREVASNPATSAEELELLANDSDGEVRTAVASNPSTPAPVLTALANDTELVSNIEGSETTVQQCVAWNPSTPAETLLQLLAVQDCRTAVASNPAISVETISELALDPDADVRAALASNPKYRTMLLTTLSQDEGEPMREAALTVTNPGALEESPLASLIAQAASADYDLARDLVFLDPCSSEVLMALAQHHDSDIRCVVAKDGQLTPDVATLLASDEEEVVRVELASNTTCPRSVLEMLARDHSEWVAETAQVALDMHS
jgi:hypothetical protein